MPSARPSPPLRQRPSRPRGAISTLCTLATCASVVLASSLITPSLAASNAPAAHSIAPRDALDPSRGDVASVQGRASRSLDDKSGAQSSAATSDPLNRREHITFQYAEQPNRLHVDDTRLDTDPQPLPDGPYHAASSPDQDAASPPYPDPHSFRLSAKGSAYEARPSSPRSNLYNGDLVGKQTGSGYVFVRRTDPGSALATLFSRRDAPVSRPPLVPNSNSRLLIGLIIVCILAVGVLTLAAQEMYRRLQTIGQPRSPLRRRSGEGRPTRTLYRSDSSYTSIPTHLAAPSLEEEEERIVTPPALSRRSSAAASSLASSPHNELNDDSDEDDLERKAPPDLHYLQLPFGIGIGYSYASIADGGDARTRLSTLAAKRARRQEHARSGSTLALSTGALPVPGTGLRSRTRSFKDLCRDALSGATTRGISVISEEVADSDMSSVSTPRWGSGPVSLDLSSSDSRSGTVTPTAPNGTGSGIGAAVSGIALEDFAPHKTAPAAKGRYFATDASSSSSSSSSSGHTLIDLGTGPPELAISDPEGITRPASTPGVMPSQVARHPQVEQLRREGRAETGKRVGKGTPTNAKLL